MKVRAKAPLRLGIAGGGTDISPYSEIYGGAVLNATINMYANTFLQDGVDKDYVLFISKDLNVSEKVDLSQPMKLHGKLILHRAVYKRVMEDFNGGKYISLEVITHCDAIPGSGLGSSSAMVVSMLEGYKQYLKLPLGEYDLAKLAYEIERFDCNLSGGKQDQYAATFGGFNFIEFKSEDKVIVNPLRVRRHIMKELEASLILLFTGVSRDSSNIISDQINSVEDNKVALEAMHKIRETAFSIKELILKGDITAVASIFKTSWNAKKVTSASISNPMIEHLEKKIFMSGAKSMKISGAGGGGFAMIFVKPEVKMDVIKALENDKFRNHSFSFTTEGVISWTI